MKRLKLKDFKLKNLKNDSEQSTEKLLGQVLGDCHDIKCVLVGPALLFDQPTEV